jgi:hypothetical protein
MITILATLFVFYLLAISGVDLRAYLQRTPISLVYATPALGYVEYLPLKIVLSSRGCSMPRAEPPSNPGFRRRFQLCYQDRTADDESPPSSTKGAANSSEPHGSAGFSNA